MGLCQCGTALLKSREGLSLNDPISDEDGDEFQDQLIDESGDYDAPELPTFDCLTSSERAILEERYSDNPPTHAELGQRYGLSDERIRQLEARALAKLRAAKGGK